MITIRSRSGTVDPGIVTYYYQDEPDPGGLLFTVIISGDERAQLLDLCERILDGVHHKTPDLLEAIVHTDSTGSPKQYALNKVCTIEIRDSHLLLEVIASSLS